MINKEILMKKTVFVDSGFWIALLDQRDQNHQSAKKF